MVPSGNTLLNLALSGRKEGGYRTGSVINLVGDSHTGKTILALSCLAEIALLKGDEWEQYRLIYDDSEHANAFDMEAMFGRKLVERIEPPAVDSDGNPLFSETVEQFQAYVHTALQSDRPFIYVLDSLDSISSEDELKRIEKEVKKTIKGESADIGSYKMEKAKKLSELFRVISGKIEQTDSLLIIISQTRERINAGMFEKKQKRSGGKALDFYCTHIVWLAQAGQIKKKKKIKSKEISRVIGTTVLASVDKNKLTGKRSKVAFDVYPSYGIDDVRSMVTFLVDHGFWDKKKGGYIVPEGLDDLEEDSYDMEELIREIEELELEEELKAITEEAWQTLEELFYVANSRKARFNDR